MIQSSLREALNERHTFLADGRTVLAA
jgi:hypothetical protein